MGFERSQAVVFVAFLPLVTLVTFLASDFALRTFVVKVLLHVFPLVKCFAFDASNFFLRANFVVLVLTFALELSVTKATIHLDVWAFTDVFLLIASFVRGLA